MDTRWEDDERRSLISKLHAAEVALFDAREVAKKLGDELKRYREREPLVQEVLDSWNLWTGQEMYGELIREGMVPSDFEAWESAVDAVRAFKLSEEP